VYFTPAGWEYDNHEKEIGTFGVVKQPQRAKGGFVI
jgi:hypothetical protein